MQTPHRYVAPPVRCYFFQHILFSPGGREASPWNLLCASPLSKSMNFANLLFRFMVFIANAAKNGPGVHNGVMGIILKMEDNYARRRAPRTQRSPGLPVRSGVRSRRGRRTACSCLKKQARTRTAARRTPGRTSVINFRPVESRRTRTSASRPRNSNISIRRNITAIIPIHSSKPGKSRAGTV